MMADMHWPVENDKDNRLPSDGGPGGFLEDRNDRVHCGIDIYARRGTKVYAIEQGLVTQVSIYTSPDVISYWLETYQIIIKADSGLFYRYAEVEKSIVSSGKRVHEGEIIGFVGQVLNPLLISDDSPKYIQQLKNKGRVSMLHLEIYSREPACSEEYLGGNWFGKEIPKELINPCCILKDIKR